MNPFKFFLFVFLSPLICYAQAGEGSSTITAVNSSGFSIGLYSGVNATHVKSVWENGTQTTSYIESNTEYGYNFFLPLQFRRKHLFLETGISYEIDSYTINTHYWIYELSEAETNIPNALLDYNSFTLNNYYVGIPLIGGYEVNKHKWTFFGGVGLECYYNYKDYVKYINLLTNEVLQTGTFTKGNTLSTNNNGIINYYHWDVLGVFGMLSGGVKYNLSNKLALSCMPIIRFTDPIARTPFEELNWSNVRMASYSLNLGLTYNFPTHYYDENNHPKDSKFSIGFNLVPNYLINSIPYVPNAGVFPKINYRFTFSYQFPVLYDLSNHFKLESGIAIDNFNYYFLTTNVLIGLPLIANYYIPLANNKNIFFAGGGFHVDYPTNIGWIYDPAHPFILPIALVKLGYRCNFTDNYFFSLSLGMEHLFPNIQSSVGTYPRGLGVDANGSSELSNYIFSTVGVGYKF